MINNCVKCGQVNRKTQNQKCDGADFEQSCYNTLNLWLTQIISSYFICFSIPQTSHETVLKFSSRAKITSSRLKLIFHICFTYLSTIK